MAEKEGALPLLSGGGGAASQQRTPSKDTDGLSGLVRAAARSISVDSAATDGGEAAPRLKKYQWLILMSLNTIGPFSSDAYVPNLSTIADELHATNQLVSFTIQINWIILALANPIVGAQSDRWGRKNVITAALLVYVAGALGSALCRNVDELIIARCVQGAGEAVSVVTSAVIRDVVEDMNERQRLQAFFAMLRPLMIMAAPVVGGGLASAIGWRKLFYVLAAWGVLTMVLVNCCIPESNSETLAEEKARAKQAKQQGGGAAELRANLLAGGGGGGGGEQGAVDKPVHGPAEPGTCARWGEAILPGASWAKMRRMFGNSDYFGLTITAALFMAAVRSMLSNIAFVYDNTYALTAFEGGALIAAPTVCGLFSSMWAAKVSKKIGPERLLRIGMYCGFLAPALMVLAGTMPGKGCAWGHSYEPDGSLVPQSNACWYNRHWAFTVVPMCCMSAAGFLALPAMQVLVMQDFKDMSGLAGGVSKMTMTLVSTLISMLVSFYFSNWGEDSASEHGHFHAQRLLWALAATLIVAEIWFWGVYCAWWGPTKRDANGVEIPKER